MINQGARRVICCGFRLVKLDVLMIVEQNLFSVEQNQKIQFAEKDWRQSSSCLFNISDMPVITKIFPKIKLVYVLLQDPDQWNVYLRFDDCSSCKSEALSECTNQHKNSPELDKPHAVIWLTGQEVGRH
jgi:hypothetical protein